MYNDDHYSYKKRKKTSRLKKLNEQEITNYRSFNI